MAICIRHGIKFILFSQANHAAQSACLYLCLISGMIVTISLEIPELCMRVLGPLLSTLPWAVSINVKTLFIGLNIHVYIHECCKMYSFLFNVAIINGNQTLVNISHALDSVDCPNYLHWSTKKTSLVCHENHTFIDWQYQQHSAII